ncbi:cytochrome o ubiquinol oxidase subunit IV [Celeribacter sp. PS-C1]|uniref:cytochrome o ubiquinol oxidase subunit IV n=1 Tax=Celeribacter sp. PS-C1 TaxID=2820813 RepID=UPI001CA4EE0C|nr:cytochrome o ubiquinol oxidase subunit IV [Celeribacter sp. PS-C1]MBW6417533.1 cytochrome o ubiquinol oxidase subunit IV [Celeribacter sp. PS-C1]
MSADTHTHHDDHASHGHGTMGQLMIGFALAAILTIIPFYLVMAEVEMSRTALVGIIMGLGAVQIIVHLVFFLHLSTKSEEGSTFMSTMLAVIILVIVLAGSLWVMHNMNENMMPEHEMDQMIEEMQSLQSQQG